MSRVTRDIVPAPVVLLTHVRKPSPTDAETNHSTEVIMIKNHPYRTLSALATLTVILFLLSASGQPGTFWSDGPEWLGALGWFGFGLGLLGLLILCVYLGIARLRRRAR
jgi:hypothetical protein